jgi:hypothetical protein
LTRSIYKEHKLSPNICQVYSLGIVLLTLATNCNPHTLYTPPFSVNRPQLESQLSKLSTLGYSKLLCNLLRIMVAPYANRPLASQIRQIFKQYEH